ncbi:MAG: hypothetical protein EZS28_040586, partial [Streblomastix strix]
NNKNNKFKELNKILDQAEVDGCYAGSTVRHAMMTKLREEGVSLEEVNNFTGHAPGTGTTTGSVADIVITVVTLVLELFG